MECRSTIGQYDAKSELLIFIALVKEFIALKKNYQIFNVEEKKVNVFTNDVGGGFGMKIFNYPEYVLTLAASKLTNRTIKWSAKRSESFLSDIHGRDHVSRAKLGFDKNNKITALKVETLQIWELIFQTSEFLFLLMLAQLC